MSDNRWDPWDVTAIGVALILATALVTGLVVANWTGLEAERQLVAPASPVGSPTVRVVDTTPVVPPPDAIEGCNRQAAAEAGQRDKTVGAVKDGASGAAIAGDRRGTGKGATITRIVGPAGGTLYGMTKDRRHDERYRAAYAECMRVRGYTD